MKDNMANNKSKKQIKQYEHSDKKHANNPQVGLVTQASDPDTGEKKKYEYDPHLDTDYDNRSLFPSQVFFPMAGAKDGWAKLAKNLKAEIDEEKIEAFKGTVSLDFKPGNSIAVKIIDDRGIESLRVITL